MFESDTIKHCHVTATIIVLKRGNTHAPHSDVLDVVLCVADTWFAEAEVAVVASQEPGHPNQHLKR